MTGSGGPQFVKQDDAAPPGFFAVEDAGLRWLAEAIPDGGAPVTVALQPVPPDGTRIVLPRLICTPPTAEHAETLGRRLAVTHAAGAPWFGCPPRGWSGDGFIGPIPLPHNVSAPADGGWGGFYAQRRVLPFARAAYDAGALTGRALDRVEQVCRRLAEQDPAVCGPAEPVARLHGDLWSGNVLWTPDGGVLIDPAAHGGHRETDLAMLALFGAPHLDRLLAAYHEAAPLADGWRRRVAVHQLHPLLVHAALFGGGYGHQAQRAAEQALAL